MRRYSLTTVCITVLLSVLWSMVGSWSISITQAEVCWWSESAAVPIPVLDQATVNQGDFLYIFGGYSNSIPTADAYRFDGVNWTQIADLPVAVTTATAVSDGTYIYILGGISLFPAIFHTSVYRYDPATNTYLTMAPFTIGTGAHSTAYLDGRIYKFAGSNGSTTVSNVLEIYDIATNSWSLGASYPFAVTYVSAFVDGGFVYGAGGYDFGTTVSSLKTYRYNPSLNTWNDAAIADLPLTRWGAASSGTCYGFGGNEGWVLAGGHVNGNTRLAISASVIRWNAVANTWSDLPSMTGERARMAGTQLGGSFYVIGGRSMAVSNFDGTSSNQELFCGENFAVITLGQVSIASESCLPLNNVADPGERLTVSVPLMNSGDISTVALTATLQATGGVTNPSGPVNYGAMAPDNLPVSRDFTFTVDPGLECGDSITLTWNIADGATSYPDATTTFTTGADRITFAQNMDGVPTGLLPAGWLYTLTHGFGITWTTTNNTPFSFPNAAFANNPGFVSGAALSTPAVLIISPTSQLTFKNKYISEPGFDGCVFEFSTNGGTTWTDIIDGGGSFTSGIYNQMISTGFMSPIAGRRAWSGNSNGYIDTVINLPSSLNGQTVKFRWLFATDSSVAATGQWVDDVQIIASNICSVCPTVQTVFPDLVTVTRGVYVSGDADSLATSDNSDFVIQRLDTDTQSRTEFLVLGTSQFDNPTSLEVTLEGAVFARSPVVQTIELFDYNTGLWELVDTRNATNMVDSTATAVATGDLSRFVHPTTFTVEARMHFQSPRARQRFSSNTDQVFWEISQ